MKKIKLEKNDVINKNLNPYSIGDHMCTKFSDNHIDRVFVIVDQTDDDVTMKQLHTIQNDVELYKDVIGKFKVLDKIISDEIYIANFVPLKISDDRKLILASSKKLQTVHKLEMR